MKQYCARFYNPRTPDQGAEVVLFSAPDDVTAYLTFCELRNGYTVHHPVHECQRLPQAA